MTTSHKTHTSRFDALRDDWVPPVKQRGKHVHHASKRPPEVKQVRVPIFQSKQDFPTLNDIVGVSPQSSMNYIDATSAQIDCIPEPEGPPPGWIVMDNRAVTIHPSPGIVVEYDGDDKYTNEELAERMALACKNIEDRRLSHMDYIGTEYHQKYFYLPPIYSDTESESEISEYSSDEDLLIN